MAKMTHSINKITTMMIREVQNNLSELSTNYVSLITRTTQLSRVTVSKFFNDQKVKPENAKKIFDAAIALVISSQREEKDRVQKFNEMRQNNTSTENQSDNKTLRK